MLINTDAHSDLGHQSFSLLWAKLRAIRCYFNLITTSTLDFDTIVSAMPVLHVVRACVNSMGCGSDYSDQAVMGSLFLSSTILLLKLVMNYFLQSFPFLLLERRTVISYWQNLTPGPFVSIRWEHFGIISLPSPPINWTRI